MISICRHRLLPDGSTTCRPISLEPWSELRAKYEKAGDLTTQSSKTPVSACQRILHSKRRWLRHQLLMKLVPPARLQQRKYHLLIKLIIVIFTLFYSLLDLRSSECNVVSLYVVCCSVNVSVCFVCCVLDSVCELFGEAIRNVCGLLLNVMDVFSGCGGALLDRPCMVFQRVCVLCL